MKSFEVMLKKEFLELHRSRRAMILLFFMIFIGLSSPLIAKVMPQILKNISLPQITINIPTPSFSDALDQFIKNVSQLGVLLIIFVCAGAIADEKNRHTLELLLAKPVSRGGFVASKFLSYFLVLIGTYLVGAIIFALYTISLFGEFDFSRFTIVALLSLLYLMVIAAATIFASSISSSTLMAGGVSFCFYIVLSIIPSLLAKFDDYLPGYIFSNYKELISNGWANTYLHSLIISVVVILVFVVLAILFFQRQEIEH